MDKLLVIQTAFTGDVVLATAVAEKWHRDFPDAEIDFLVRKGNEGLLKGHPFINQVLVWDKSTGKTRNLLKIIGQVRRRGYSHVVNLQRFFSSGLVTVLSGAQYKVGFDKNPLAFLFSDTATHTISTNGTTYPIHEVDRNQRLIAKFTDDQAAFPVLYPAHSDYQQASNLASSPYVCIAPSSVWFTKQFPAEKWGALLAKIPEIYTVYLLGGPSDKSLCDHIIGLAVDRPRVVNLCGSFNYLQSAALMASASMNYTNDSAPLHFATAMNAPVTAVFCSTVPSFGFGPLRENGRVVEALTDLSCRPCGLHGHKSCPEGHFKCAADITNEQLLWWI